MNELQNFVPHVSTLLSWFPFKSEAMFGNQRETLVIVQTIEI